MPTSDHAAEQDSGDDVVILGEEEAYKVYLSEKVRRKGMTAAEADACEANYRRRGQLKTWLGPAHDGREVAVTMKEIAEEMGSWWAKIYFKSYGGKSYVILKGFPGLRETLKGVRYKLTNAKFVTWQIARADMVRAARKSTKLGIWIVCVADVLDYFLRDNATIGQLLGHLTVDIPAVAIASVVGVLAQMSVVAGAEALAITVVASGPLVIGFLVAVGVGYALTKLDEKYHIADRLGDAIDEALANLRRAKDDIAREMRNDAHYVWLEIERARALINLLHDVDRLWRDLANGLPQIPRWRMLRF